MFRILLAAILLTSFGGVDVLAYEPIAKPNSYASQRVAATRNMVEEKEAAEINGQKSLQQQNSKKAMEAYFNSPQYKHASEQAAEYLDGYVGAVEEAFGGSKQTPKSQPRARVKFNEGEEDILNRYRSSAGDRYGLSD